MLILNNIDDFLAVVPVNSSFTFDIIESFVKQAENKYIMPVLGNDFYKSLAADTTPDDVIVLELYKLIRAAVAHIALSLYLPFGNVQISDSGIQIISTNDRKTAFEWQVNRVIDSAAALGMDGLETVLTYLDENLDAFPVYADSDAYKANNALFINTATEFNDCYNIFRSRLTFNCLYTALAQAEEEVIIPQVGDIVAADLKAKIADGTLTKDEQKLVRCIRKALAFLAIKEILPQLEVEISPQGLAINYISKSLAIKASEPAPDPRITSLKSYVKEKVIEYLDAIPAMLPGYIAPATGEVYNIDNSKSKIFSLF